MTTQKTMKHGKKLDRGSALLVALMIMVVLSLTGLSFLYIADSENSISNNYTKGLETLTTATTGVKIVSGWFNAPDNTNLVPSSSEMVLNTRTNATDSTGAATTYGGNFMKPYWGIVGNDNVVQRFFGNPESKTNPTNPDILIDLATGTSTIRSYLKSLNTTLFGADTHAVITKIEVYSGPTYPDPDHPWNVANTLYGICTVRVTANMYRRKPIPDLFNNYGSFNKETISTRIVRGILGEAFPFKVDNAIDAMAGYGTNGDCPLHWGTARAHDDIMKLGNCNNLGKKWYPGSPMHWQNDDSNTHTPEFDPRGFRPNDAAVTEGIPDNALIYDPWDIYLTNSSNIEFQGGTCSDVVPTSQGETYPGDGSWNSNDRYNMFAGAQFDWGDDLPSYAEFKELVMSNLDSPSFHYCKYKGGGNFKCTGVGTADTIANITDANKGGVWFFDTQDGAAPLPDGSNLTPADTVNGAQGIYYINATEIELNSTLTEQLTFPWEPFIDENDNGKRDHGEPFINLAEYDSPYALAGSPPGGTLPAGWSFTPGQNKYPMTVEWDWDPATDYGGIYSTDFQAEWDNAVAAVGAGTISDEWDWAGLDQFYNGPGSTVDQPLKTPLKSLAVDGVLFNAGNIHANGNEEVYGALIAGGNVDVRGTIDVWYKACLRDGSCPIPGLDNSTVMQIITDY